MTALLEMRIDEISGLKISEWIEIRATLHAIENDQFNCSKCLTKYASRKDGEEMTEAMRKAKGCREVKEAALHSLGDEITFRTCPGNFYRPQVVSLLEASRKFEAGVMPYAGGLMDQPNKVVEIFGVMTAHRMERQAAEQKKADMLARAPKGAKRG